ncbi:unnamed protein product [Brassica napus]|uniref:(rape) hypothetical protein n=1 Tax=Brassica napus TaxID=3708 RepID=A0A816R4K2_BRANA|nr:unnamed protein product [Brassica napus]
MRTTRPTFVSVGFCLLFLALPLSSLSQPSVSSSVYDSFLKCLSEKTKTSQSEIAKIVFSQANPSYTSVLRAYIRNARFNKSSTPKPTIIVTPLSYSHYMASGAVDMVHKWQFVGPKTDKNLFMRMLIQPATRNKVKTVRATVVALFLGKADDVVSLLAKELPELALKKENCREMTWFQSALYWYNYLNATQTDPKVFLDRNLDSSSFGKRKSDYVETEIPRHGIESLFKKMIELGKIGLVFNPYGGRMAEIAEDATPFPHRNMLFKIQYSINWKDSSQDLEKRYLKQKPKRSTVS